MYPILDKSELNKRYKLIERFQEVFNEEYLFDLLKPNLKKILDIEKLHRKMGLLLLTPYEFYTLHTSYIYLQKVIDSLKNYFPSFLVDKDFLVNGLSDFINQYKFVFNMNELEKYSLMNMITSIFNEDIYSEIDELQEDITKSKDMIECIRKKLEIYIDKKKVDPVKCEVNDKYGTHLYVTETRSKTFNKSISNLTNTIIQINDLTLDLKDIKFVKRGANMHIEFSELQNISNHLIVWQQKIQNLNRIKYLETIDRFYKHSKQLFDELVKFIGIIDLNCNIAKISIENIYKRPEIIDSEKSFIDGKDTN